MDLEVFLCCTVPLPQLVEVVVWLAVEFGVTTTGGGTCTTGGGTCTTGAGAGTVSTSFVLEKHPERSPPMASDTIIEQNPTRDRIIFPSNDVNEGSSSNRAIALIGPIGPVGCE
jgi:hypothetical protein